MSTIKKIKQIIGEIVRRALVIIGLGEIVATITIVHKGVKIQFQGDNFMAELREGQFVEVTVNLKTYSGKTAKVQEGSEEWSSSNESVASVVPDAENPLKARIYGEDGSENGSALIEFRADADLDEDEFRPLVVSGSVTVTQGEAVTGEFSFGKVTDIPVNSGDGDTEPVTPVDTDEDDDDDDDEDSDLDEVLDTDEDDDELGA